MSGIEAVKPFTEAARADGANLVDRYFGLAAHTCHLNPAPPARMELRRQGAHYNGVEISIHFVTTHDDDRAGLRDLAAPRGIEIGEVDRITLRWGQLPGFLVQPIGSCCLEIAPVFLLARHVLERFLPR